jgi:hypothetical protein
MPVRHLRQRLADVLEQMLTIRHLHCLGRALGVVIGRVAADDLHFVMRLQPDP